jgi:hypothetical protein
MSAKAALHPDFGIDAGVRRVVAVTRGQQRNIYRDPEGGQRHPGQLAAVQAPQVTIGGLGHQHVSRRYVEPVARHYC